MHLTAHLLQGLTSAKALHRPVGVYRIALPRWCERVLLSHSCKQQEADGKKYVHVTAAAGGFLGTSKLAAGVGRGRFGGSWVRGRSWGRLESRISATRAHTRSPIFQPAPPVSPWLSSKETHMPPGGLHRDEECTFLFTFGRPPDLPSPHHWMPYVLHQHGYIGTDGRGENWAVNG